MNPISCFARLAGMTFIPNKAENLFGKILGGNKNISTKGVNPDRKAGCQKEEIMERKHCENCGGIITPLEGISPNFCGQVCFEAALIRKIRRRIEDRLRKTTDEDVLAVARLLGIPEEF
jgi:hypothetical protein